MAIPGVVRGSELFAAEFRHVAIPGVVRAKELFAPDFVTWRFRESAGGEYPEEVEVPVSSAEDGLSRERVQRRPAASLAVRR